jgi:hypothetical protein
MTLPGCGGIRGLYGSGDAPVRTKGQAKMAGLCVLVALILGVGGSTLADEAGTESLHGGFTASPVRSSRSST